MSKHKNSSLSTALAASEDKTKTFFDMISPSVLKFNTDHFICGNQYRSVWAIRDYPTITSSTALLSRIGSRKHVTLHIFTREVTVPEFRSIIHNAQRSNTLKSASEKLDESVEGTGNINDIIRMLENSREGKSRMLHCAVFIEISADSPDKLREIQNDVEMELVRNKIDVDRLTLRQKEGFMSVHPCGKNVFADEFERVLPAESVANLYPFSYSGKTDPNGFYIGRDRYGSDIIADFDKRDSDKTNSNILILGNSGMGKSYLMKLLLTNLREAGKSVICLDAEQEYRELTENLGGCYMDMLSGEFIINPLEPRIIYGDGGTELPNTVCGPSNGSANASVLSGHINYLKDFLRVCGDFNAIQSDAIEMLLTRLYGNYGITDATDFSKFTPNDYPTMSDFYALAEAEYNKSKTGVNSLFTEELLRDICLGIHSVCIGAGSKFFNGHTNITDDRFLCFGVKGLPESSRRIKDAMLFNILSYMTHRLLTTGNTVAAIDELYLFLTNPTAIEYIRNASKRVRKKNSALLLASQNIDDFLIPGVREYTKPLFSIPSHTFLFNPGSVNESEFADVLQLTESEFSLIRTPERGSCLYRCGNERYLLQVIAPEYKAKLFGRAGGK